MKKCEIKPDPLPLTFSLKPQLEQALRFETGDEDHDSPESRSLAQQNVDLRRRLDEEQAAYKRKLTAYQEGQQRQAQLVQKLQAKVRLFYFPLLLSCY